MLKRLLILAALLILLLSADSASAEKISSLNADYEDVPVNIKAVHMDYDRKNGYLTAKENVEITQLNRTLTSEYIRINLLTKDTEARGNVVLVQGGDTIYCDSFNINLDSQIGYMHTAKIIITQENLNIQGREIAKLGPDKYMVKDGTITTCDGENPAWRIDAENIDVTIEGYARIRNSMFRIKNIPVMYLPYIIFPVKAKRQSGFLSPDFSRSSSEGTRLDNSFFWAISESTDATIWLDAATKKGLGTGLEYRFKLKEDSWGKMYGYFADERNRYFDHEYRDIRDRDPERGYLNFEGEHYFSSDFYAKAQMSYITDREFYGDYREEVRRSKSTASKTNIGSREKDESVLFFNKNWDFYNLLVNGILYKNLTHNDPNVLQRLPQVYFSGMPQPLWGTSLIYQFGSSYDFFWREEGQTGHRVDIFPKISWPINWEGWLQFTPEIGMRGISYFNLHREKGLDKEGLFPSLRAELSTTFLRIFENKQSRIRKLKHAIEPGILYENVPYNDQEDFPEFDIPERFFRRHSLGYYIKNRFTGLIAGDREDLEELEIGYIMLGQSFNISRPKQGLYLKGDPEDDFSDIFGELRLGIFESIYLKTKAFYNPYDNNLRYYTALINWSKVGTEEYLQLQYCYGRNTYENFDVKGRFRLTRFLYVFFDARYYLFEDENGDDDEMDTEFGIDFSGRCWGTRFSVETEAGSSGRSSDTSFNVHIYLKGLGDNLL